MHRRRCTKDCKGDPIQFNYVSLLACTTGVLRRTTRSRSSPFGGSRTLPRRWLHVDFAGLLALKLEPQDTKS